MYAECAVEVQVELLLPQLVCSRTRANGSVTQGDLNLNFILDERARITLGRTQKRFGSFWKIFWRKLFMALEGNVPGGSQQSYRDLFPIPA
jgi:hypothetical protein